MSPETRSRRAVLAIVGGTMAAGGTGVYALANYATQTASAQVDAQFESRTITIPADRSVEEVYVRGSVTGQYESPGGDADHLRLGAKIRNVEGTGGEVDGIMADTAEIDDADPSGGEVEEQFEFPTVEGLNMGPGHYEPRQIAPVSRQVFSLLVSFRVYDADDVLLAEARDGDQGTIRIGSERDFDRGSGGDGDGDGDGNDSDGGGDTTAGVSAEFGFRVEEMPYRYG